MLGKKQKSKTTNHDPIEIPKTFWKHYDNYRRRVICLAVFAEKTGLPPVVLRHYLSMINIPADTCYNVSNKSWSGDSVDDDG